MHLASRFPQSSCSGVAFGICLGISKKFSARLACGNIAGVGADASHHIGMAIRSPVGNWHRGTDSQSVHMGHKHFMSIHTQLMHMQLGVMKEVITYHGRAI
jgi:hypothetical protein